MPGVEAVPGVAQVRDVLVSRVGQVLACGVKREVVEEKGLLVLSSSTSDRFPNLRIAVAVLRALEQVTTHVVGRSLTSLGFHHGSGCFTSEQLA